MSDTDTPQASQPSDDAPAQAPSGVTREEFTALQTTINQSLEALNQSLQALAATRNANPNSIPQAQQPIPEPSLDEIETALRDGSGGAEKLAKYIEAQNRKLIEQHIKPLQEFGTTAIANLTKEQVRPQLKHYERFKKEIDAYIDSLPPTARANPAVHKLAYNAIVGDNIDKIIEEEKQKLLRSARDTSPTGTPSNQSKQGDSNATPDFMEVFGREAVEALRAKNMKPDDFARRMGYKDAAEYVKFALEQRQGEANA